MSTYIGIYIYIYILRKAKEKHSRKLDIDQDIHPSIKGVDSVHKLWYSTHTSIA